MQYFEIKELDVQFFLNYAHTEVQVNVLNLVLERQCFTSKNDNDQ